MDATLQDPLVGRLLDDRYEVRERIDRGGMATVYQAVDRRLDRTVALKVLHSHLATDESFAARFDREARAAAKLSHPNVVSVFDQGQDGDLHYLAMEYLPGRTLRQVLHERGPLSPKEAFKVMDPVLDALAAAHRAGLVHRDVKPENVILTDDGRVKVADFGLARASTAATNASTGVLLGTVAYLAPELVVHGTVDTRGDVYSAGVMLFEMLTGRQPFVGDLPAQVAYRHVHENVPAPSELAPNVPEALDDVVLAATARDAQDRPADAAAMLTMLRAARRRISAEEMNARADGYAGEGVTISPDPARDGYAATEAVGRAVENRTRAIPGLAAPAAAPLAGPDGPTEIYPPAPAPVNGRILPSLPVNEPDAVHRYDEVALARLAEQRRRRGIAAMAGVVAAALVLVIAAWYLLAGPGARVTVPTTTTLTQAEATTKLKAVGLVPSVQPAFSDKVKEGLVVSSTPAAGTEVKKNAGVILVVSKGPELFDVPDVSGQSEGRAGEIIEGADFRVGKVTEEFNNDVAEGEVIRTSPKADSQQPKGTAIDLVLSKGPELADVPDLRGQSPDQAKATLEGLGLQLDVSDEQRGDATVPAGMIAAQDPQAGSKVEPGRTVTVFLSTGQDLVQVPDVRRRNEEDAVRTLQEAGLQVTVERRSEFFRQVLSQNPDAGTMVPRNSVVTIVIV